METEKMPLEAMEIVKLKQLPIIEQRLQSIKEQFEAAVEEAQSLECTEETYKHVKARRAELTKIFNALEARRKAVKAEILAPYEAFEKIYRECITNVYKPCDEILAGKITEVTDELKAQKISDAKVYFDEYAKSRGIDFLEFEQAGITVGLSKSAKSIRADIKAFLDKVAEDLEYINTLDRHSEILMEYRKGLNLVQAINTVEQRHKEIEEIEQAASGLETPGAVEIEMKTDVEEFLKNAARIARETDWTPEEIEAGLNALGDGQIMCLENPGGSVEFHNGELYETDFRVWGSLEDLKALKAFLEERKMRYEQL